MMAYEGIVFCVEVQDFEIRPRKRGCPCKAVRYTFMGGITEGFSPTEFSLNGFG